jgi:hypothetical protein
MEFGCYDSRKETDRSVEKVGRKGIRCQGLGGGRLEESSKRSWISRYRGKRMVGNVITIAVWGKIVRKLMDIKVCGKEIGRIGPGYRSLGG